MNINDYGFREGSLVCVNIAMGTGATTRYAEVTFADGHSDALTLVDCDGKELRGDVVSVRHMTIPEVLEYEAYQKETGR